MWWEEAEPQPSLSAPPRPRLVRSLQALYPHLPRALITPGWQVAGGGAAPFPGGRLGPQLFLAASLSLKPAPWSKRRTETGPGELRPPRPEERVGVAWGNMERALLLSPEVAGHRMTPARAAGGGQLSAEDVGAVPQLPSLGTQPCPHPQPCSTGCPAPRSPHPPTVLLPVPREQLCGNRVREAAGKAAAAAGGSY